MMSVLKKQKSELENKMKKCKVSFGMGDIDDDVYTTTIEAIQDKLSKIDAEMAKVKRNLSNLTSTVDEVVATCCKLGSLWSNLTCNITKDNRKFYEFIYESGLGEKNSTGMGFLNNVR